MFHSSEGFCDMTAKHGMLVMTDEVMESWYRVSILIMTACCLSLILITRPPPLLLVRIDSVCHDDLSFISYPYEQL